MASFVVDPTESHGVRLLAVIVESDIDGGCQEVRKFLRHFKKLAPAPSPFAFCVLALARNTCSFSATSIGAGKYKVGVKVQKLLVEKNGKEAVEMGTAEVELEDIAENIMPWIRKCGKYVAETNKLAKEDMELAEVTAAASGSVEPISSKTNARTSVPSLLDNQASGETLC